LYLGSSIPNNSLKTLSSNSTRDLLVALSKVELEATTSRIIIKPSRVGRPLPSACFLHSSSYDKKSSQKMIAQ
jgi:hypothetical protein